MSITLNKPIDAHGEQLTELTLREPTAKDVQELGFPYLLVVVDDAEAMQIQAKTVGKYIVRLAGIPPSSVDQMSPADFSVLMGAILGFFGVEAPK